MSDNNIVLITWAEPSKAYEVFSKIRDADFGGVQVDSSAVIERLADGQLRVTDGQDNEIGLGTLGGGALGTLIGILGGPVGLLLGFAGGAIVGSFFDVDRTFDSDSVISEMSRALPPGRAGVVLEVQELSPKALADLAASTGGSLIRRTEDEVLDEIAAAEEAADAAARAADEKVKAAKKVERREKRDERIAKLKEKLHIGENQGGTGS